MNYSTIYFFLFILLFSSEGYSFTRLFESVNLTATRHIRLSNHISRIFMGSLECRNTQLTLLHRAITPPYHQSRHIRFSRANLMKIKDNPNNNCYANSIQYYNDNAQIFYQRTINSNMSANYEKFMNYLAAPAKILDLGCGVGRDAHFFESQDYKVTALDGSEEMINFAKKIIKDAPILMKFGDMKFFDEFDGVWAAASLIHVPNHELKDVVEKIYNSLRSRGIFFATFKHGVGEYTQEGRTFYYMKEDLFREYIKDLFDVIDIWKTDDNTSKIAYSPDKIWLNILVRKITK